MSSPAVARPVRNLHRFANPGQFLRLSGWLLPPVAIAGLILNSATGVFSVLGSASRVPAGVLTGAAVASMSAQSVLNHLAPVLTNDQLEKFETEVLEPALVLDGGSCVERTVFALSTTGKPKAANLSFHVR